MAEYLSSKNPWYYYTTVPVESLVLACQNIGNPTELPGCMKQHFIIFKPKEKIFCKEYLCDCNSCLQFDFENCTNEDAVNYDDNGDNSDSNCEEEIDDEIDKSLKIFEFITVPSFVCLCYRTAIEPLYFVQITGKGVAEDHISDPYGQGLTVKVLSRTVPETSLFKKSKDQTIFYPAN